VQCAVERGTRSGRNAGKSIGAFGSADLYPKPKQPNLCHVDASRMAQFRRGELSYLSRFIAA